MKDFSFASVDSIAGAIATFERAPEAIFLAGGTTVVDLLREGVMQPETVVDITGLPLREIQMDREFTRIGAMVSNAEVAWNPGIQKMFPAISEAILSGASGQIRNMASTGGNLLQRTRCPYYRDLTAPCNRRQPATGCAAMEGVNRSHAILGVSDHCIATHPSDFAVSLVALDARIVVVGAEGERTVAIDDFYLLPGDTPERETTLRAGELISAVLLPHTSGHGRSHYVKVRDRQSYEFALASAAVAADRDGELLRKVRVALGGVGTVPWRARAAEDLLEGQRPSESLFAAAADAELAAAHPRKFNSFKVTLAKRTLATALGRLVRMS